jgi:hypothetical protein
MGESGRWIYFTVQALLFYILLFLAIYSCFWKQSLLGATEKKSWVRKEILNNLTFAVFIVAFVLISRVPLGISGAQNPDEALWIAMAKTLAHDPRYWVSVDGGTGGPLVPFSLHSLKLVSLPIDFGSLKIMTGIIMAVSTCFLFFAFAAQFGHALGRVMILPLVVAVAVMKNPEMTAYNSEHLVLFLLSLALFFLVRIINNGQGRYYLNLIALGFLLGSVPFAKLQGTPVALLVGLFACVIVYQKTSKKSLTVLIASALSPTILVVLVVLSYSGLNDFWISYISANVLYTTQGEVSGFAAKMTLLNHLINEPRELSYFIRYSMTIILLGLFLVISFRKELSWEGIIAISFSISLVCVSVYCVVAPGRSFTHYILLLFIPLSVLFGQVVRSVCDIVVKRFRLENNKLLVAKLFVVFLFLLATVFYHFQSQFSYHPDLAPRPATHYGYASQPELVAGLNQHFFEGAKMVAWGWGTELYVETNFLMGTRYGNTAGIIEPGPLQFFYEERFLKDIEKNKPVLFVDVVAPGFFRYSDRSLYGFENFLRVKNYIDRNYSFDSEMMGVRIFKRNTLRPQAAKKV